MDSENSSPFTMPVAPMYGGNQGGFGGSWGGDWGWIILLLLLAGNGGWGMGGGFGGFGGGLGIDFPWILNGQNGINTHISDGFRDAQISDGITSIRDGIGNLSTQLCSCCSDMQMSLANGFAGVEQGANARQMANMQQGFGLQTAISNGFANTAAATADLKYTIASEACADRAAVTAGIQTVLDKLCQLELDGYKREADNLRAENSTLKNQNFIANEINMQNEVFYNRLKNCPVNAVPVAGNTPLFNCNPGFNSSGCGCGCGGNGGF